MSWKKNDKKRESSKHYLIIFFIVFFLSSVEVPTSTKSRLPKKKVSLKKNSFFQCFMLFFASLFAYIFNHHTCHAPFVMFVMVSVSALCLLASNSKDGANWKKKKKNITATTTTILKKEFKASKEKVEKLIHKNESHEGFSMKLHLYQIPHI